MPFFIFFVLWPLAELFVIVEVARWLGFWMMLLLLIISWPIGIWLIRSQGRLAWQRLNATVSAGRVPTLEVIDGALVLLGGLLLMIPGFIGDVVGLLLMVGPLRKLADRYASNHLGDGSLRRIVSMGPSGGARRRGRQDYDVEATAVEADDPELPPRT